MSGDLTMVKMSEIAFPHEVGLPYVRGSVSTTHVNDLAVTLIDGVTATGKVPFLDGLLAMRLPEPVKGSDPKMLKQWEAGKRYVQINGIHRVSSMRLAASESRVRGLPKHDSEIPMTVIAPVPAAEIVILQLQADMANGLKIDHEQREAAIRSLVKEHGREQADVAKIFKLAQSSISRIVNGKQTLRQLGIVTKRRGGKGATRSRPKFDPLDFLHGLIGYARAGKIREKTLLNALDTPDVKKSVTKDLTAIAKFVEALAARATAKVPADAKAS